MGIGILARDVVTYSTAAALAAEPRPSGGFSTSPAFSDGPQLNDARADYVTRVLGTLLWPHAHRPTFDACLESVQTAAAVI